MKNLKLNSLKKMIIKTNRMKKSLRIWYQLNYLTKSLVSGIERRKRLKRKKKNKFKNEN